MATYTYYVITDTHGYPWGSNYTADFDLGDNTPSFASQTSDGYDASFQEEPHSPGNPYIRLPGNHDASYYRYKGDSVADVLARYPNRTFKPYTLSERSNEKIAFFGINTVENQNNYSIPISEITTLAQNLQNLPEGTDIAILTHVPLFKTTTDLYNSNNGCYTPSEENKWGTTWNSGPEEIVRMLQKYKENEVYTYNNIQYDFNNGGHVIGCFCGHIHNHVQCYYKGIYMESFGTNGEDEWTSSNNIPNRGLYMPPINKIIVNLTDRQVNGRDYKNTINNNGTYIISIENKNSGTSLGDQATGTNSLTATGNYLKFYDSVFVGYSPENSRGVVTRNTPAEAWFYVDNNTYLQGAQAYARYIRFDASGKLRYYKNNGTGSDITGYEQITGYNSKTVTFSTNNRLWTFVNGLFSSCKTIYRSGTIYGKNNFSIVFDSNGYAKQINENGVKKEYPAGDNWINIYNLRVFWRPFTDHSNRDSTGNVPQIGITGTFGTNTRIDLARSTTSGSNWIPNRYNVLIRVVGENNVVSWLYDGRLTNLTDSELGI